MRSQSKVYLSYIRYPSFTVWTKIEFAEASNALIKDDRNTQCQPCSKISSIRNFSLRIQTKSSRNKNLQCCYSYHNHKRTKKQSFQNTIFRALKLRWYSLTKWYNQISLKNKHRTIPLNRVKTFTFSLFKTSTQHKKKST